jgi:protein-S-isoprenylcysteine O-methyltransferase Ste14
MSEDRILRWALLMVGLMVLICAAALFGAAGRLDIVEFWCWLGVLAAACFTCLLVMDPDLVRERARPGGKRPSPGYFLVTLLLLADLAVAGLDRSRLHWSDSVPTWLRAVALLLFALAWVPFVWAVRVNRFFSSAVRIQHDRGQHVISDGPYRFMRHPGYATSLVLALTSGVALGSWLAAAICWLGVPVLFWRTQIEDRMLRAELPGYDAYATRVKYRLLPGVW